MVPTGQDLLVRDPVLFFKACEAMFLVAVDSLKKMFGLVSLNFRERDER